MLLRLIRRSAKLGAAEALATTGLVSELSSEFKSKFKDDLQHGKEALPDEMLLSLSLMSMNREGTSGSKCAVCRPGRFAFAFAACSSHSSLTHIITLTITLRSRL